MQPKGFTLLECIIVMVIVMILFAVAIPLFKKHPGHDITQTTKQLKQHLELAKSIAVHQQAVVTVCGSSDAVNCDHQWDKGYIIFMDNQGKGVRVEGEPLIAFKRYEQEVLDIRWKGFLSGDFIQFSLQFAGGQNGTLTLSDRQGNNQRIIINSVGRIRVEKAQNST